MNGSAVKSISEVFIMFNNGMCGNSCWWIIILLLLFCGCGNNGGYSNNGCYNNNNCCDNNCGCC